jgi:hypothetical protein
MEGSITIHRSCVSHRILSVSDSAGISVTVELELSTVLVDDEAKLIDSTTEPRVGESADVFVPFSVHLCPEVFR